MTDTKRLLMASFSVLLLPSLVLVDTVFAFMQGWRPLGAIRLLSFAVCGVAGVAIVMGLCLLVTAKGRGILRRGWVNLLVLCGAIVAGLLVSEVLLKVFWSVERERFHRHRGDWRIVFRPSPERMPGVSGESEYTLNSIGVRGPALPKSKDTYKILCIGGSSTECSYLDDRETWPHLLMVALNSEPDRKVWVGNVGMSSYNTVDHLLFARKSELMDKIDCLLLLIGFNDLAPALMGKEPEGHDTPAPPLWIRLRIVTLARVLGSSIGAGQQAEDIEGRNYEVRRRERADAPLLNDIPDLEDFLAEYAKRIREISEASRARGVRPVFVTQPVLWDGNLTQKTKRLLWCGKAPDGQYYEVAALRRGMDIYNEKLRSACDAVDAECIVTESMNGRGEYFYDDDHLNEAGARELARLLADYFVNAPIRQANDEW